MRRVSVLSVFMVIYFKKLPTCWRISKSTYCNNLDKLDKHLILRYIPDGLPTRKVVILIIHIWDLYQTQLRSEPGQVFRVCELSIDLNIFACRYFTSKRPKNFSNIYQMERYLLRSGEIAVKDLVRRRIGHQILNQLLQILQTGEWWNGSCTGLKDYRQTTVSRAIVIVLYFVIFFCRNCVL